MHAHSGLVILAEPQHEPKVRQGITTELIGIDGNSYAPFHSHDDFLKFAQINSGLDGNPRLPGRWSTVEQYLDMFTRRVAVNIAYVFGNSPLRHRRAGVHPDALRRLATTSAPSRRAARAEQARSLPSSPWA
jgi:N-acyl-D-amino-acid deacylase